MLKKIELYCKLQYIFRKNIKTYILALIKSYISILILVKNLVLVLFFIM